MQEFTLRQRLRYAFDNTLSRGTPALIAWLALVSIAFIALAAVVLMITGAAPTSEGGAPLGFFELMWHNLMRTLDAGTMGGDAGSVVYLLIMLTVTLGGVFIVGTLIGLISNGVGNQIDQLRKGRSVVAEKDHIVILGWNDQIFSIIGELILGNENRARNRIVIMADRDKVEMEDEIRERIDDWKTTRVVCRRGSPIDLGDLHIVNFNAARAIVILSPPGDGADAEVIKAILAITNHPKRRSGKFHIVAEIRERRNMEPAALVGRDEAQLIETGDVIARVIAQTCRQTGLSTVYTELLDYGGDEIYFKADRALDGLSFADALFAFDDSALIGMKTADGIVRLNPPMTSVFASGDQAIVIAKDLQSVKVTKSAPRIDASLLVARSASAAEPEKTLILGWNGRAPVIVRELDRYAPPGSQLLIVADTPDIAQEIDAIRGDVTRHSLEFRRGDTTDRATLESLNPEQYQHIIVLCYSDHLDVQKADAKTLVTLLHMRDLEVKSGENRYAIVTEMLDFRNRELAEITQVDDFIVSEKLTSLLIAQITENRDLQAVFTDIFDSDGSEIYLKPAGDYVKLGAPASYWHVVDAARQRGEVAIGYRIGPAVTVNPPKNTTVSFAADDRVIVIAED
ncbi:MAG: CASTOR/POLLUX-related putative ion channel [Thermoanaerobaculia bacterium]